MVLTSTCDKEDEGDHKYLKATDILSDMLKQLGNLNVVSNVWNDVNVSDPLNWFDENAKNCKHIVLVCTPLGKKNWVKNNTNDLFVMGLKMLRKQRIKKRWFSSNSHDFSVIYFDHDPKICIPDEMVSENIKHQNISNNLNLFFYKTTGKKLDKSSKHIKELKDILKVIHSNMKCTTGPLDSLNPDTALLSKHDRIAIDENFV